MSISTAMSVLPLLTHSWGRLCPVVLQSSHPTGASSSARLICACATAADSNAEAPRRPMNDPSVDTRIHWGSSDDGWVGQPPIPDSMPESDDAEILGSWGRSSMMGLLVNATDSHYRYLELLPDAEPEEIKAAYRRLSKMYHPDTTSLPVELAAEKFVRLREAYTVLISEQERRFYDWRIAQEVSDKQSGRFIWPSEAGGETVIDDDDQRDSENWDAEEDYRETIELLGERNMGLSNQARTALLFDGFAVCISILCILYAGFVQHKW